MGSSGAAEAPRASLGSILVQGQEIPKRVRPEARPESRAVAEGSAGWGTATGATAALLAVGCTQREVLATSGIRLAPTQPLRAGALGVRTAAEERRGPGQPPAAGCAREVLEHAAGRVAAPKP